MLGITVNVEYVTDPVLVPHLRCPHCQVTVRQIRKSPSASDRAVVAAMLAEPLWYVVLGLAALVGYLWEALFGLIAALLIFMPIVVVWLYVRSVRRGEFICSRCGSQFPYTQVAARR